MTRFLGIDYGARRIGLAIGDDELRIATPLDTLSGGGDIEADARAALARAADEGAGALVVGLPINMNDTIGPQAALTRRFIAALRRQANLPVHEQDERLSSFAADEALSAANLSPTKRGARRDMLAARAILQAFLDRAPSGAADPDPPGLA